MFLHENPRQGQCVRELRPDAPAQSVPTGSWSVPENRTQPSNPRAIDAPIRSSHSSATQNPFYKLRIASAGTLAGQENAQISGVVSQQGHRPVGKPGRNGPLPRSPALRRCRGTP